MRRKINRDFIERAFLVVLVIAAAVLFVPSIAVKSVDILTKLVEAITSYGN